MLQITCPVCGQKADETEFTAGGEAHIVRPASSDPENISDETFRDYLYVRDNPRGPARELWLCARGCGKWFHAVRDTFSLEFKSFYLISDPEPELNTDKKPRRRAKAARP